MNDWHIIAVYFTYGIVPYKIQISTNRFRWVNTYGSNVRQTYKFTPEVIGYIDDNVGMSDDYRSYRLGIAKMTGLADGFLKNNYSFIGTSIQRVPNMQQIVMRSTYFRNNRWGQTADNIRGAVLSFDPQFSSMYYAGVGAIHR